MKPSPQSFRSTADTHRVGLAANRPSPDSVLDGTFYYSTDTGLLERSDGLVWEQYSLAIPNPVEPETLLGRGVGQAGPVQEITLSPALIMSGTQLSTRTGIFNYTYNDSLQEPPAAGQARLDVAYPWNNATKMWLRFTTTDEQDLYWGIMILTAGSILLMQDKDEHIRYGKFVMIGAPIDKGLYAEIPIQWQANGSPINTAARIFIRAAGGETNLSINQRLDEMDEKIRLIENRIRIFEDPNG